MDSSKEMGLGGWGLDSFAESVGERASKFRFSFLVMFIEVESEA